MQKTVTINGKRYTGKQLVESMDFDPASYTYWVDGTYVVPRTTASDVDMAPGALCDPADAVYVEVGLFFAGKTKMVKV
ncbi:hypothetical protein BTO32_15185 [Marinobacter lutaoensis]|uniref:Uncharacterized protein n=1 Tax=Marinobacter lutaoensis TaxID=135739 RepID=A0A1V2DPU0_9GAMM|nr:hypothetical protein [Marinobacter lutaoensis]ONF42549.1 hypothetical protein BTO32_15185 [Marinobacter lutaoensis]